MKYLRLNESEKEIRSYLRQFSNDNKILLTGYKKSGNTWLRFLIFNYFNIMNNGGSETLTYEELNDIQSHSLESNYTDEFEEGFPIFYRSHQRYKPIFDAFDEVIYLYRSPLDCLVSNYHFLINRPAYFNRIQEPLRTKLRSIDYYVKYKIRDWIYHYKLSTGDGITEVRYKSLKEDTLGTMKDLFEQINLEYDEDIMKKSVEFSSFKSIKKMGQETGQQGGMAGESLKGEFTRKGTLAQYEKELKPETVDYLISKLDSYGIPPLVYEF